jgi:hypothetical protein
VPHEEDEQDRNRHGGAEELPPRERGKLKVHVVDRDNASVPRVCRLGRGSVDSAPWPTG